MYPCSRQDTLDLLNDNIKIASIKASSCRIKSPDVCVCLQNTLPAQLCHSYSPLDHQEIMMHKKTKDELQRLCASHGIPIRRGKKKLNKSSLLAALQDHDKMLRTAQASFQAAVNDRSMTRDTTLRDDTQSSSLATHDSDDSIRPARAYH